MNVATIPDHVFATFHANQDNRSSAPGAPVEQDHGASAKAEPTYAEAFPPLPEGSGDSTPSSPKIGNSTAGRQQQWSKMSVKSSVTTQVFSVPVEERRFREMNEQHQFGERGREQAKICSEIMAATGVTIEISQAKDQSLTVVVTGKPESVMKARKMMVERLQTQTRAVLHIPKEHHRYLLGSKGKRLNDLELQTATKINIPRANENSDEVTIVGTKEGIERARLELQLISDEQAKLAVERLPIPYVYHVFICGPDNQTLRDLMDQTGARISVPPHSVAKNEIVVSGEKEGVMKAKQVILAIYDEKKRKTQTVSVEVKKSQHRYVIGNRGNGLSEILAETGVSVEVPPIESASETITLRGEADKLGPALTMVYSRANSVVCEDLPAPAWLHRYVIGKQGANVKKISQDFPRVHVEITEDSDVLKLEGPPDDVASARARLTDIINDLESKMAFVDLDIDPKYHRHIIGRHGANVSRLKKEYEVEVHVPGDGEQSRVVRVEGVSGGVALAKQEILDLVEKMENEKSRDLVVERRLHRLMIGSGGAKIKEVRDRFPTVQVSIPDSSQQSDIVKLRGPKGDVDKCYIYLQKLVQELIVTNQTAEVSIFKQFYRDVIGRNGAFLQKVREECECRIEMPGGGELSQGGSSSDHHTLLLTGSQAGVNKAKKMLEEEQDKIASIKEETVEIPHTEHSVLLGNRGRFIQAIREECGGVLIRFPATNSKSDKILVKGPVDDVKKGVEQLKQLAADLKEKHASAELRARPEFHRYLIGKNGANVRNIQKTHGVRVTFPSPGATTDDPDLITLIGCKEDIEVVKKELEAKLKDLENTVEIDMEVDQKHHKYFVSRRGEVLNQIADEFGGVNISFPRINAPSGERVRLKGPKECVEGARARIEEIVKDLDSHIMLECVIPQKHHRIIMGPKGQRVNDLCREFNVNIRLPERASNQDGQHNPPTNQDGAHHANQEVADVPNENGDSVINGASSPTHSLDDGSSEHSVGGVSEAGGPAPPRKQDIIVITGKRENCEAARDALLALIPVTEELTIANDLHRFIIGAKGRDLRRIMNECDVNVSVPPAESASDTIRVTGQVDCVAKARAMLMNRVKELEEEKEMKIKKGYRVDVKVDRKYHPKIIGRRGMIINKIRTDNDVQIQFPDKSVEGTEEGDIIVITGLEENAHRARDDILKIVNDLEDMLSEEVELDPRIHPRLIGARGRGIHRIMEDYKVDIRFPGKESPNQALVVISGRDQDLIEQCKDHLLNLQDEYLDDIADNEPLRGPSIRFHGDGGADSNYGGPNEGFTVRDAPWSAGSAAPDTESKDDFPDLGGSTSVSSNSGVKWGPARR